jgi:hypothetical protein
MRPITQYCTNGFSVSLTSFRHWQKPGHTFTSIRHDIAHLCQLLDPL